MKWIRRLAHEGMAKFYQNSYQRFLSEMPQFKKIQEQKIAQYDPTIKSYQEFIQKYSVTDYSDYRERIDAERKLGKIKYHPTSGSTHHRKWIPYTEKLKHEFDCGVSPWLGDLYRTFPQIKEGTHYWSISWLPTELRSQMSSDDVEIMPLWKKILLKMIMSVPSDVQMLETSHDSLITSLTYLCADQDLTLISIWSPTYLISFLEELEKQRFVVAQYLETGNWKYNLPCPQNLNAVKLLKGSEKVFTNSFLRELWPKLSLISAWDTGSSALWANRLKNLFSHVRFQGKALLTTEAIITIPFHHQPLLAYQSHFYEFQIDGTDKIVPSWELERGMIVSPIVTTGSQFFRYRIPDLLKVDDFYNGVPSLRFLGRQRDVDMVGEKISPEIAQQCFEIFDGHKTGCTPISLLAILGDKTKSRYILLLEGEKEAYLQSELEKCLKQNHHYALARDLGQLDESEIFASPNARRIYQKIFEEKGMISGEIKIEPLTLIKESEWDGVRT